MNASGHPPGWYDGPDGGERWWDGTGWTEHRRSAAVALIVQPPLAAGLSVTTPWISVQALVPIAQALVQIPYLLTFRDLFAAQLDLMRDSGTSPLPPGQVRGLLAGYGQVFATFGVVFALSLLLTAGWVVLAALDFRRLTRIGIVQPFHWAWSFLGLVYPIGRTVVLHRRVGRGAAPLWVLGGALITSVVLTITLQTVLLIPLFAQFGSVASSMTPAGCGC